MRLQQLPLAADRNLLACGAWLKNTACQLKGDEVRWSALHGDLGDPENCIALETSVACLLDQPELRVDAVAHDLHPDFFSTHFAQRLAAQIGVPAIAVQHHHAHIAAVVAEHGLREPVIGIALDGVGLGDDGSAWGGELLWVDGAQWRRLGNLRPIALPGGDLAAREPWRMASALLHALGRNREIAERFGAQAGSGAAKTVQAMLERNVNCPPATGAGRWFDAAAGALGISVRQAFEAEAAMALEKLAGDYLAGHDVPSQRGLVDVRGDGILDLSPLLSHLFALADGGKSDDISHGAALFHVTLADALAVWAEAAAQQCNTDIIALGGGCFFNRILSERLRAELERRNLRAVMPQDVSCGDAGLALGQAWVAAHHVRAASPTMNEVKQCV